MNDNELEQVIHQTADNTTEPILYQLSNKQEIPTYENTLPIHRKIYDKANMEMYELYLQIKELNPECELVGIKTDCLVFNNITDEPPISNKWGGIKKCDVPLIKECTVNQEPKIRTDTYEPTNKTWNIIKPDDAENHIDNGYLVIGKAGTGKTFELNRIKEILIKNETVREFITACPTHKACKLINGVTIHKENTKP